LGSQKIKLYGFLLALATLSIFAAPSRADDLPDEQCAKGPVSDIPESIRQTIDEQTGIVWYTDKSTTKRLDEDAFYLYAGKKGCEVWLRLRAQYVSDKPASVARLQIKADAKTFDLSDPHFKRDSDGKLTWQWLDERVSADHLLMLFTITASKNAVLRFGSANRTDERTIGEQEKAALKAVLSTYRALGGQL
jgi:hypothetical protein